MTDIEVEECPNCGEDNKDHFFEPEEGACMLECECGNCLMWRGGSRR